VQATGGCAAVGGATRFAPIILSFGVPRGIRALDEGPQPYGSQSVSWQSMLRMQYEPGKARAAPHRVIDNTVDSYGLPAL